MMIISSMFGSKSNRNQKSAFLLLSVAVEIKSIEYEKPWKKRSEKKWKLCARSQSFFEKKVVISFTIQIHCYVVCIK